MWFRHKYETWVWIPNSHIKKLDKMHNSEPKHWWTRWWWRQAEPRAPWPASLAKTANSRFSERPRQPTPGFHTCPGMNIHTCAFVHEHWLVFRTRTCTNGFENTQYSMLNILCVYSLSRSSAAHTCFKCLNSLLSNGISGTHCFLDYMWMYIRHGVDWPRRESHWTCENRDPNSENQKAKDWQFVGERKLGT